MKPVIIGILVVVVLAIRLRQRRRSDNVHKPSRARQVFETQFGVVGLIAAREVRERTRGKLFRAGTLLMLIAVAAAIVIPRLNTHKTSLERVGVVGTLPSALRTKIIAYGPALHAQVSIVTEKTTSRAKKDLRAGSVDLLVVDATSLVTNRALSSSDTSATALLVRSIADAISLQRAYEQAGLSPAQAAALSRLKPTKISSLQPVSHETVQAASIYGLILTFILLQQYGAWTLMGIAEEKASRVVEVLLAAVRPIELLAGKVLGIGIVALAQAGVVVAFALVLAQAVGSSLLSGAAPLEILSTLLWFLLGYGFYSWVFAAAGSLAERQDQVQSLTFPLGIPIIVGYITSLIAVSTGSAPLFVQILAFLPPTAPLAMPALVGLGQTTWWAFCASVVLSLIATAAMARLAAGIYRRAILRTGRRVRLREITSRASS